MVEAPTSLLSVGVLLQYTIPLERRDVQTCATLLGWKEGSFVISGLPYQEGEPVECRPGNPCVVRYLHDGKVVGYRSEIRGGQLSPEPLLFLSFPERIDEILLRKHPRIPVHQPIMVRPGEESGPAGSPFQVPPLVGVLQDLSIGGCRASLTAMAAWMRPGASIRVEFELPGIGHVANLSGTVKNLSGSAARPLVGLEFQFYRTEYIEFRGWGGTVQKAIEQFVAQHQHPASVK